MFVLANHALPGVPFLPDDVAENAAFLFVVIVPAIVDFFAHAARHNRQRDQLRVGMIDGCARGLSVILENQNVPEALVIFQIQHPVAVSPEHVFHRALRKSGQRRRMVRRLDDHFMRADSVHLVEEALSLAVQFAFDTQCGKFIRHHANVPARRVRPSAIPSINQNLRRSLGFIPRAEGAILRVPRDHALAQEIVRALPAFRCNDHPSARNWIFAQLRQSEPP